MVISALFRSRTTPDIVMSIRPRAPRRDGESHRRTATLKLFLALAKPLV